MIRKYFKPVENTKTTTDEMPPRKKRGVLTEDGLVGVAEVEVENVAGTSEGDEIKVGNEVSEDGNAKGKEEEGGKMPIVKPPPNPLLHLESTTMSPDWYQTFLPELTKPYFLSLKRTLNTHLSNPSTTIYPSPNEIYTFTKCPLSKIKVVILGQDPYHGPNQAHGLCFSVKKGVTPPPSLNNIFRELQTDLGEKFTRPPHGFLEGWVSEGVLLLNAVLTVKAGQPNSHKDIGWATFTDRIILYLNNTEPKVFMLWGGYAQKKGKKINEKKHLVLKAAHPSPLSANKGGWFGCRHFSKANEWLRSKGVEEVDWNHLP